MRRALIDPVRMGRLTRRPATSTRLASIVPPVLWAAAIAAALMHSSVAVLSVALCGLAASVVWRRTRAEEAGSRRFGELVRSSTDLITLMDADTTIRYQTPAIERILGYTPEELLGTKLADVLHPDDRGWVMRNYEAALTRRGEPDQPTICRWRHRDGSYRYVENVRSNLLDNPHVRGVVLNSRDVTERRELEDQLRHRAFHDALTGLPNRDLFEERLERAAAGGTPAVLFVDLDSFKTVNDNLGHATGDDLLVEVARRLRSVVGADDTVARFGGDEFAVLVGRAGDKHSIRTLAQRILDALAQPLAVACRQLVVAASVGVAIGSGRTTAAKLMQNADVALYRAKSAGKGRCRFYEPAMHAAARERFELEAELRDAVESERFVLHYQPVFDVATGALVGTEALLRWVHPERGLVSPGTFIPLAEQTRLVVPIGQWVAREACRQAGEWARRHPGTPLTMSINLSFVQAEEVSLVDELAAAISVARIPPERLVVEITEGVMMRELDSSVLALYALKQLGVELVVDDFGTGYSSLSYLNQLPLDGLKIPKPFIDEVEHRERDYALTHGLVELAHTLGLRTVAEGVETDGQLERVAAMGCDLVQGYLLGRPGGAAEIEALLGGAAVEAEPLAEPG